MKKWIVATLVAVSPVMLFATTQIDQLLDQEVSPQGYHTTSTIDQPARTVAARQVADKAETAAARTKPVVPVVRRAGPSKEAVFSHTVARVFAEKQVALEKSVATLEASEKVNADELFKLNQKLIVAQAQTNRLITIMKAMNQQISQQRESTVSSWLHATYSWCFQWFKNYVGDLGAWACTVVVTILVLWLLLRIIGCMCGCGRRCPCTKTGCCKRGKSCADQSCDKSTTPADTSADSNEYDFLGSVEGVAAKLDLGRAYIEMEDYHAARKVLMEVIEQGEAEQQMEAQGLIDEMPEEGS